MFNKERLKQLLVSYHSEIERRDIIKRELPDDSFGRRVFVGIRRAGKSYMLYQKMQELLASGKTWADMLYLNFEDSRLTGFTSDDFETILESHEEVYGTIPMLFLDEIQTIDGWESFARRLADADYKVWITGSNAKMLSREIESKLGARYLTTEVYPYSFEEQLSALGIAHDEEALLGSSSKAAVLRQWSEYMQWGGLPEAAGLNVKRDYISSTFQKIYLGDICSRNRIASTAMLRLMLKKIAESVGQPISYNRLASVLSSVSGKVSMPTISKYVEYCEEAWVLMRLRNVSAPFAERETINKYYFADNGILNLFLINGDTHLLENLAALTLFRKYGHNPDNERVYFYNDRIEVDFYVPEDKLAIQVSYSVTQDEETFKREVTALQKLPKVLPCRRRLILTYDESGSIEDDYGTIEILPLWQLSL